MFEDYTKSLNNNGHVGYDAIYSYVSGHPEPSVKERSFIERHFAICSACRSKFDEVFDFEWDQAGPEERLVAARFDQSTKRRIALLKFVKNGVSHKQVLYPSGAGFLLPEEVRSDDSAVLKFTDLDLAKEPSRFVMASAWWWRYAAAAIVIIGFAYVLKRSLETDAPGIATVSNDSIQTLLGIVPAETTKATNVVAENKKSEKAMIPEEPVLAQNYEPNPILEDFVNQKYRSAKQIRILSPGNGDTAFGPIAFVFEKKPEEAKVIVYDNKGNEVWQAVVESETIKLDKKLRPGLYYWQVYSRGQLVETRKVIFKGVKK